MQLSDYINDHIKWSLHTFGPGRRAEGLIAHILKECDEVLKQPDDVVEWIDIAILAIDGAWRAEMANNGGKKPSYADLGWLLAQVFKGKQEINKNRKWPINTDETKPTEHVREE